MSAVAENIETTMPEPIVFTDSAHHGSPDMVESRAGTFTIPVAFYLTHG